MEHDKNPLHASIICLLPEGINSGLLLSHIRNTNPRQVASVHLTNCKPNVPVLHLFTLLCKTSSASSKLILSTAPNQRQLYHTKLT